MAASSPATGVLGIDTRLLKQCVHCGLCLDACPTYRLLGDEADSPRGRIFQMRLVHEGKVSPKDLSFREHMYACLDCRACQTACPSGVQYGKLIEAARTVAEPPSLGERTFGRSVLNTVFTSRPLLSLVGLGLRLYQHCGASRLLRATGLGRTLPGRLVEMEAMLPPAKGGVLRGQIPEVTPPVEKRRARVGFVSGCVMDELMHPTNEATVRVLARNGCEVITPREQRCCGALHMHTGATRDLARHNVDVFEQMGVDAVVVNAAGCGSTLKEYGGLLQDDSAYAQRARQFSLKVKDISEFLAEIGLDTSGMRELRERVTYQDACHLAHAQGIRSQPRQVLQSIPGLELVEMRESDVCCGSAGIYNLTHAENARQLLEWKIDNLEQTKARIIATPNPGCTFQIAYGARQRGLEVEVVHVVDLLDRAYQPASNERTRSSASGSSRAK